MPVYFLDSSALPKLYHVEVGSAVISRWPLPLHRNGGIENLAAADKILCTSAL